jgi:hypothetical protein
MSGLRRTGRIPSALQLDDRFRLGLSAFSRPVHDRLCLADRRRLPVFTVGSDCGEYHVSISSALWINYVAGRLRADDSVLRQSLGKICSEVSRPVERLDATS